MYILEKAIKFAVDRHTGMVRKGTDLPYCVSGILPDYWVVVR